MMDVLPFFVFGLAFGLDFLTRTLSVGLGWYYGPGRSHGGF